MEWLQLHCSKAYIQVQDFIRDHGHQGFEEFDLITETWGMKPAKFLAAIQTMMNSTEETTSSKILTPNETLALLKTPINRVTRWILRLLLPKARNTVARREFTKALTIEMVHMMRLAYRQLAELLKRDGKLPDEELIFFLTHQELNKVIEKSSPSLLLKAVRRRKIRPQLQKYKYHEINYGFPMPIEIITSKDKKIVSECGDLIKLQGTSVCTGTATGRAYVALALDEANEIQSGDILITHATDIGWSPYFPLLGGIATEIGGLISHGAVVAREYGLPCIVNVKNATRIFKTGDTVTLNGNVGTIEIIKEAL